MRRSTGAHRAEEQLITLSAGTAAHRQNASAFVDELATIVDWSAIAQMLRARRLLPLLGVRLIELAGAHAGDEFAVTVAQATDAGRRHGAFLQLITARVMSMLDDAGIASTALKGPLLSEALYGDPGRRPASDIDLLVAHEQLREAVEIVRELGYSAPTDHLDDRGLPRLHFALIHERDELPPVELHWRIHWYEQSFARERLLAPRGVTTDMWRPTPADELTALLLFYARDGFLNLRLATDIGAHWDAFSAALDRDALDQTIRSYPALERVLLVAATVAEKLVGLPLDQLTERRVELGSRGRLAARLANPHPQPSQPQLHADMGLVDGLLAPRGGFKAFVRRQVIPPREVLREHARTAQQRRATSRLGYGVRVLTRYGLAMARLLRVPERIRPD
jgi:hypothetical protein